MLSPQMTSMITHLGTCLGLTGGGAWAVKASGKHVTWLMAVLGILFVAVRTKADKDTLVDLIKALPKP